MNQLISLMPRAAGPLAFPCFTKPTDIQDLNRLIALFHTDWQPISQRQLDGLAHAFASKTTPSWVLACVQYRCRQARLLARLGTFPSWPLPDRLTQPVHEFEGWVRTRAQHFRFPNPARTCVPAALAMECVEDMVAGEMEDFLDYLSLRTSLAHSFRVDAESLDFSVEDWRSFRCNQQQARRGMGSFLAGAYVPKPSIMFSVN